MRLKLRNIKFMEIFKENKMTKYAIHTKWSWPNGVPSAETMQERHRELKSKTKAEDIIWFKIDENTHQSVIIFSSEEDAQEENAKRQELRKQTIEETGHSLVEETMGPILSIMSEA
tara:strand:- start:108 stop:455 length:348 start_codon:yes stop_codon:yes gene_type:complete